MLPADRSGLERAADRLQPALLDRLVDDAPQQPHDAVDRRVVGDKQLRRAVLRDLGWLLNATCLLDETHRRSYPWLVQSVLNFGLPPLAGQLASRIDVPLMERTLRQVKVVDQRALDKLFNLPAGEAPAQPSTKGIEPATLERVKRIFSESPDSSWSVEQVVEEAGISKTTGRRYLEYCVEIGFITIEIQYGNIGHPRRLYRRKNEVD